MQRACRVAMPICGTLSTATPPLTVIPCAAASANTIVIVIWILPEARTAASHCHSARHAVPGMNRGARRSWFLLLRVGEAHQGSVRRRLGQRRQRDALAFGVAA